MSNKETILNKRYERDLNYKFMQLACPNAQRDYYIKEQEPGLIDLYSKDGHQVGELIELGFKSIEDVAKYIDILSGIKNHKLFPEQPTGRTSREKSIGTCIMLDASAQECLKDLIDADYRIWPDSFHSFIIAEDRDVVDKLIKKYHLTEMRRGVDIFDTHNVYNGDIVDYVSQSTTDGDEYSGPSINRTFKDIMRDARKTRHDEYAYLSQKYDFDESLEKSIYEQLNDIDDQESLLETDRSSEDSIQVVDSENNELTPTQIKYFHNSKIRDNQGNLLVCYHGSDYEGKLDTLDIAYSGYSRKMLFFSDSNEFAISFANRHGKGQLFKCYINIENPLVIDAHGASFNTILFNNELKSLDEIAEAIKDTNYDGIIAKNVREYHEGRIITDIITFKNNQIKLITNKNPTSSNNMNQ